MMKKAFIPLLGALLLHSSYTTPRFSDSLIAGFAGFTTGLVTSAIAQQCSAPEVVVVETCPAPVYAPNYVVCCSPEFPCSMHRTVRISRHHTKVKRQPRRRRQRSAAPKAVVAPALTSLNQQKEVLAGSIKELELRLKEMRLNLQETELLLKQANKQAL